MKPYFFIFLAWCLLPKLVAQPEVPPVIAGINAYDQGKYEVAIRLLTRLVITPDSISDRDLPTAHYYLAQAYYRIGIQPGKSGKYPNALLYAATHLLATRYTDKKENYSTMVGISEELLWPLMYNAGVTAYNEKKFTRALAFFEKARQLNPTDPNTPLTQGYVHWQLGDTLAAIRDLERAFNVQESADSSLMEEKERHGFYLLMAEGYLQQRQQQKAKEWIERGFRLFPDDPDLRRTERNFFRTFPQTASAATEKLLNDLKTYPEDADRWMTYARLLELQGQTDPAHEAYRNILLLHPDQTEAHRELGVYHVNLAAKLERDQYALKLKEAQSLTKTEITCHLQAALPHMQHLHRAEPENMDWMEQLVSISRYLDLPERKIYRKEKKALKRKLKKQNSAMPNTPS